MGKQMIIYSGFIPFTGKQCIPLKRWDQGVLSFLFDNECESLHYIVCNYSRKM